MFTGDWLYMLFMHQACVYKTKQQYVKSNEILTDIIKEAHLNCRINDILKDAIQAFQVKMNVKQEYLAYYVRKHIHNCYDAMTTSPKLIGSWGRRSMAVAGEVTQHGQAHPYSWSITIISLRSKESEECHRSEWKTKLLSMFLTVRCQHASGACQSHSRPVLNLREALWKCTELSPSTPPFLTLRFHEKDLTPTLNLLQIRPILPPLGHILSVPSRSFG